MLPFIDIFDHIGSELAITRGFTEIGYVPESRVKFKINR